MQSELNTPRYRRDPSLSLSLNSSYTAGGGAYAHPFERVDQNHTCAGDRERERESYQVLDIHVCGFGR